MNNWTIFWLCAAPGLTIGIVLTLRVLVLEWLAGRREIAKQESAARTQALAERYQREQAKRFAILKAQRDAFFAKNPRELLRFRSRNSGAP